MSRPRTPTKILEARGAFKANPNRRRDGEPEVTSPLGGVPAGLNEQEVGAWQEIAGVAPIGVLTGADRIDVELAARLLVKVRNDFDSLNITALRHLHTVLGKYGLNPSDRAKLSIEKTKDVNPFDKLS